MKKLSYLLGVSVVVLGLLSTKSVRALENYDAVGVNQGIEEVKVVDRDATQTIIEQEIVECLETCEDFYSSLQGTWVEDLDMEDNLTVTFEDGVMVMAYEIYGKTVEAEVRNMYIEKDALVLDVVATFVEGGDVADMTYRVQKLEDGGLAVDLEEYVGCFYLK